MVFAPGIALHHEYEALSLDVQMITIHNIYTYVTGYFVKRGSWCSRAFVPRPKEVGEVHTHETV
jgi:hypothetical protein